MAKKWLGSTLALCLAALPALGMSVKPMNLNEIVGNAQRIFVGECIFAADVFDENLGAPATLYRIRIDQAVRGDLPAVVEIRQLGHRNRQPDPKTGRINSIPGIPTYSAGQKLLLFMNGNSRYGLTSPIGMMQGSFVIVRDLQGRQQAVNGVNNRGLFKGMDLTGMSRSAGLTASQIDSLQKQGGAIDLTALLKLVEWNMARGGMQNDR